MSELTPTPHTEVATNDVPPVEAPSRAAVDAVSEPAESSQEGNAPLTIERHQLEALRRLLVEEEQLGIATLRDRLDHAQTRADEVAAVLPEAFSISTHAGQRLASAMGPTVETALHTSAKQNPQVLADAIYPVMGPAIRKSIRDALGSMVENVNRTIESRFTARGMKWRLEARRSGRSYAEVALSHNLLYNVDEVYLIHRETGLLLLHVKEGQVTQNDADLVSGMLTAIQDFVGDSFHVDDGEELEQFSVGDLTVMVEHGPFAVLAAVVRGQPPRSIRADFQEALESIHGRHADLLEHFDGEASTLVSERTTLESCLLRKDKSSAEAKTKKRGIGPFGFIASTLLAAGIIFLAYTLVGNYFRNRSLNKRWDAYIAAVESEPGLHVVLNHKKDGQHSMLGLRDPLAIHPAELRAQHLHEPDPVSIRWMSAASDDPEMLVSRVHATLKPPGTVNVVQQYGTVHASGLAPTKWLERMRDLAPVLPGMRTIVTRDLIPAELGELAGPVQALHEVQCSFEGEDTSLSDELRAHLREMIHPKLAELERATEALGATLHIKVRSLLGQDAAQPLAIDATLRSRVYTRVESVSRALRESLASGLGTTTIESSEGVPPACLRVEPALIPEVGSSPPDTNKVALDSQYRKGHRAGARRMNRTEAAEAARHVLLEIQLRQVSERVTGEPSK